MKSPILIIVSLIIFILPQTIQATEIAYGGGRYICYDSRSTSRDVNGNNFVRYRGCHMSNDSCGYNGANHFGRYPNSYQARRALDRCRTNTPRFVD